MIQEDKMQVQINTDHNVKDNFEYISENNKYEDLVRDTFGHYSKHITRVEVHFSDVNSKKTGFNDKRCLIEVRVVGIKPMSAVHHANKLHLALDGAVEKLKNSLERTFGKLKNH